MDFNFYNIVDDAAVALYSEGVSETKIRDAVVAALGRLASKEVGPFSEIACILDEAHTDKEILEDLKEFNAWETPNEKEVVDANKP